jgi:hypothetical protein
VYQLDQLFRPAKQIGPGSQLIAIRLLQKTFQHFEVPGHGATIEQLRSTLSK